MLNRRRKLSFVCFALSVALPLSTSLFAGKLQAQDVLPVQSESDSILASPYVPMDSWIYPAFSRLAALGFADSAFFGLRPWTRRACLDILAETEAKLEAAPDTAANREARELYNALAKEFAGDAFSYNPGGPNLFSKVDQVYTRQQYMSGEPINDSYHLGQTLVNDDGRPYEGGFEQYTGFQMHAAYIRFALDVRGEVQDAPGRAAYPEGLLQLFSTLDQIPLQPDVPLPAANDFRLLNANLSFNVANNTFSVGKGEDWWGPDQGTALAWSTNAEPIYALRINRTEPLMIPLLSRILGPFRYEGVFGELKQQYPKNPWIHAEKIQFKPTPNLEFGFSRVVVFAGEGHVPLTFGSFWHSFTSFSNVSVAEKNSRNDPGARHSSFDFSYRLPFMRKFVTLYSDSIVHDDTSPIDAPRHAFIAPGLYFPHVPYLPKVDVRVEADDSAAEVGSRNTNGNYYYWETQYRQCYTNKGYIFGGWIGRESKGGQAWITYWLNPQSRIVLGYRNAKANTDFISGGTTQNDFNLRVVYRLKPNVELNAFIQEEQYTVPVLRPGEHGQFTGYAQLTWYPKFTYKR